jgi:diguanylate cyclase
MAMLDLWTVNIPIPVALAAVATIGYVFGRRRSGPREEAVVRSQRELRRAKSVASELEKIAWELRKSLASHHSSVNKFRERVGKLGRNTQQEAWKDLCREAEEILKPTLQLAAQIANAYDALRHQSTNLMTFTEVRTDPLTGVNNRRGLDDALTGQFALFSRYHHPFSVAIFDIDHFKKINDHEGHLFGDHTLQDLARVFDEALRETDVLARYGGEEFMVVMPQTELAGASVFAERLRALVEANLPVTVSGGVAEAIDGDTQDSLLARADSALYEAKSAGRNRVYLNDGQENQTLADAVAQ